MTAFNTHGDNNQSSYHLDQTGARGQGTGALYLQQAPFIKGDDGKKEADVEAFSSSRRLTPHREGDVM